MTLLNPLLNQSASLARKGAEQVIRQGARATDMALGTVAGLRRGPKPDMDDVTLARKVETEIFRGANAPKAKVDVNAANGVVELRGEVKNPAQKAELEAMARKIPEVRDVHNLLHLQKTPAPTRADAPGRARRSTATESKERTPRTAGVGRPAAAHQAAAVAEPTPAELAARREGRRPAPFGARDNGAA